MAAIKAHPELLAKPQNAILTQPGVNLGDKINSDSSFLNKISPEFSAPIKQAFAEATTVVFTAAAITVAVAFLLSWFIKEQELRKVSGMQERAEAAAAAAH